MSEACKSVEYTYKAKVFFKEFRKNNFDNYLLSFKLQLLSLGLDSSKCEIFPEY